MGKNPILSCECLRSWPVDDGDGIKYCRGCGTEFPEEESFDAALPPTTQEMVIHHNATRALPRRLAVLETRSQTPRFRAKQAARILVKKIHPEDDGVRKIALEYVELGWDESTPRLKQEPHLCQFGHPNGIEYVAAACLYRARKTVGICSDRIQLAELCLRETGVAPSTRKMNRTLKSLKKRVQLKKRPTRINPEEEAIAQVRPLTELALSTTPELMPIRKQLIVNGEKYCSENPVRSGNPLNIISALAYVLQRTAGIGLNREQVRTAFGATTTMGHFIPEMKDVVSKRGNQSESLSITPRVGVQV